MLNQKYPKSETLFQIESSTVFILKERFTGQKLKLVTDRGTEK